MSLQKRFFCEHNHDVPQVSPEDGRRKLIVSCLENLLIVPETKFNVEWRGKSYDVLSINRSGVGEAHVVKICQYYNDAVYVAELLHENCPAPFRWVTYLKGTRVDHDKNYAPPKNGGFVGLIEVDESPLCPWGTPGVNITTVRVIARALRFPGKFPKFESP